MISLLVGTLFLNEQNKNTANINRLVIDGGTWLYVNKIEKTASIIQEKLEGIKFKQANNHDPSEDIEYAVEYSYELVEGVQNYNLQDLTGEEKIVGKSLEETAAKISANLEKIYESFPPEDIKQFTNAIDNEINNIGNIYPFIEKGITLLQGNVGAIRSKIFAQAKVNKYLNIALAIILFSMVFILYLITNGIANPIKNESKNLDTIISSSTETSTDCQKLSGVLSDSAVQQLEAVTETAAACEQISQTLKVNLDQADEGAIISKNSLESIDSMMGSTQELVNSIEELKRSNDNMTKFMMIIDSIQEKTSLIDEIVFQTKLLSFNASVEAERAGEYGRGFGVVAQEIGTLAKNSGAASIEIASLIKNSLKQVEDIIEANSENMDKASLKLEGVSEQCKSVQENIQSMASKNQAIAKASKEQSMGINQVNEAILDLNKNAEKIQLNSGELSLLSNKIVSNTNDLGTTSQILSKIAFGNTNRAPSRINEQKQEKVIKLSNKIDRSANQSPPMQKKVGSVNVTSLKSNDGWENI